MSQTAPSSTQTLNIIGCGKAGRSLARLWAQRGLVRIRSVLNRSLESSRQAVAFIGAGTPAADYAQLPRADLVMISAPDRAVGACAEKLAEAGVVGPGSVVFHLSGCLPSAVLEPARAAGASIGSLHPVKSFADPAAAAESFAGSFCCLEGEPAARRVLGALVEPLGAEVFYVRPEAKPLYHAASVLACNYLAALLEAAFQLLEQAGIGRDRAAGLLRPIVLETAENVFRLGPAPALTGPIARGDQFTVAAHLDALSADEGRTRLLREVYVRLGRVAAELAAQARGADEEGLREIRRMLEAVREEPGNEPKET